MGLKRVYFYFTSFYREHFTSARLLKNKIILVYTLGKVGSATIYHTLKKIASNANIYHVHFLSDFWLEKLQHSDFKNNVEIGQNIRASLDKNSGEKKLIVSLVREPVTREISNIFQNPHQFIKNKKLEDVNPSILKNAFLQKRNDLFNYTLNWFDTEFKNFTGIDIYQFEFNKKKGYSIYRTSEYDILLIKLEKLNWCYQRAFKEFFGIDISKLYVQNESSNKVAGNLSETFKEQFTMDADKLDEIYASKYMKHFYDEEEILAYKKKWLNKSI